MVAVAAYGQMDTTASSNEPKAPTAKVTDCGHACHLGGAKKDEVWTQFYPLLDK